MELSAVMSTSKIFESFLSGMFFCGLDISVDASSSSKLHCITLSARSDPNNSQKDLILLGSDCGVPECVGVDVDCPESLLWLALSIFRYSTCGISSSELSDSCPRCSVVVLRYVVSVTCSSI